MTARREASTPPRLPGYEFLRVLGLGGFADVFLYQQELPRREVAVKVLLAGSLDDEVRRRFQQEANHMAQLSHHPSIVTIYHAAIAADGRPFLVMEYCSRPGLAERYRQERISVAESLRIGIRLASAVETAHRAGILHRDIKPANVLTTDFGWPALTDFGIAATTGHGGGATVGMSIPWSPPELLGDHPSGDERSDVYSLAATIYSLLAGRTPFEIPGGQNTAQQLVARIERAPLPLTGRDDVPPGLQEVLERAMAKHPARRFASAAAVARALQQVEADLRLPITPLELTDAPDAGLDRAVPVPSPDGGREDATRLRSIVSVAPGVDAEPAPAGADDPTRLRGVTSVAPHAARPVPVFVAPPEPVVDEQDEVGGRGRPRVLAGIVSGVIVLAAVAAIGAAAIRGGAEPGDRPTTTADFTQDAEPTRITDAVPSPHSLLGTRQADGSVVFTWENPDPQQGDQYLWGVRQATGEPELALVEAATVTVPADPSAGQVCVEVAIVRADRRVSAAPAQGCAP
ncbi:serine/threonine-protein kinase [Cellulomonas fengjieae]|uniref:non-specific serine/threonine protein kinase n=1 Tax=Cellulomonas fengjieae TaxID=2819978 RepID=A0ABS3SE26_9CELL|nr:serine/threonine-protein kinase [Cellulomonas fengjieae]MBO3084008.1 serine/threonine protein kinase [Cellulomonas fengjieae]QVI64726.1 serine/threonine protein kinase [Cellulomonas fengjieae]